MKVCEGHDEAWRTGRWDILHRKTDWRSYEEEGEMRAEATTVYSFCGSADPRLVTGFGWTGEWGSPAGEASWMSSPVSMWKMIAYTVLPEKTWGRIGRASKQPGFEPKTFCFVKSLAGPVPDPQRPQRTAARHAVLLYIDIKCSISTGYLKKKPPAQTDQSCPGLGTRFKWF